MVAVPVDFTVSLTGLTEPSNANGELLVGEIQKIVIL